MTSGLAFVDAVIIVPDVPPLSDDGFDLLDDALVGTDVVVQPFQCFQHADDASVLKDLSVDRDLIEFIEAVEDDVGCFVVQMSIQLTLVVQHGLRGLTRVRHPQEDPGVDY